MLIGVDRITDDPNHLRRIGASAEQDAALEASIRAIGIVQPVLVRPDGEGFIIVAGRRRLRAARAAGLTEIPAEVREFVNGDASAAEAAENMVRAGMAPLDQWRAIGALQERGFTLDQAALALGLPDRLARRLDKLGRLHPDMLAAIEKHGMPDENVLAQIAGAPHDVQRKALPKKGSVDWWAIQRACIVTRISRDIAIFDVAASNVLFEEDLFAQPGAPDHFTTMDVPGFLTAQENALVARVNAAKKKNERLTLSHWQQTDQRLCLPPGWREIYATPSATKLKGETGPMRFVCVRTSGYHIGAVEEIVAEEVKQQKPAKAAAKGSKPAAKGAAPEPARSPITKAGLTTLAVAKTEALRASLRAGDLPLDTSAGSFAG